jgi:uncharacterized protein
MGLIANIVWIIFITFTNYKAVILVLPFFMQFFFEPVAISLLWVAIAFGLCLSQIKYAGLDFDTKTIQHNYNYILRDYGIVLMGLILFILLGFHQYFSTVRFPLVFFIVTPIVEELIFRGYIYGKLEQLKKYSPVIITSALFALHHLQYFNYRPTPFALFQIGYTFILGLLLGDVRKRSGSVYLSILLHVIINFVTVSF